MSPHECGLATPWLMEKVGGSGNAQGFTLVVLHKSWLVFEPGFLLDGAMDDSS